MSGKRHRLARDALVNLFGALLPVLITLVTLPMYLRAIGDARYGVLTLVWLIVGFFGLFDLGLGRAATNRLAKARMESLERRTSLFWTAFLANLGLGTAGGLVLWGLTAAWGAQLLGVPSGLGAELSRAMPFLAMAVPVVTTSFVLIGSLDAQQDFAQANAVSVLGASLSAILPLMGALIVGPTLDVVVAWTVMGRLLAGIIALWACRRANVFRGVRLGTLQDLGSLLGYGGWVSVSSVVSPLLTSLDRLLISNQLGAGAVPHYAIPFSVISRVQVVAGSLQRALFPRFSAEAGEPAKQKAVQAMQALAIVMTPILTTLALLLRPFLSLWIGPEYAQQAGPVGELLVLGIWVNSLAFIPYGLLQAEGRPDLTAKFHLAELGPYVVVLWLGLRYYGLPGAALAWSLRVLADAALLLAASQILRKAVGELGLSALLVAASGVVALVLPSSAGPRIPVACGMGGLSLWWAWRVATSRFESLVSSSIQALWRCVLPQKEARHNTGVRGY